MRHDRFEASHIEEKTQNETKNKKKTTDCLDVMNIWANKRLNNNGTHKWRGE